MGLHWDSPIIQVSFALLLAIIPITVSEIPVMWKCVLWAISWAILLYLAHSFIPGIAKLPIPVRLSLAVGLSAFLVAGSYGTIFTMWIEEKAAVLSGELEAPLSDLPDTDVRFQIGAGSDGTTFVWTGGNGSLMNIVGDKMFIRRENGKLLLSVNVRQRSTGAVIVSITDNKWTISPEHSVSWEHNYTQNALEVKDGRGRIVLQVVLTPETVRIQGEWWHENGNGGRVVRPFPYDLVKTGPEFVIMTPIFHPDDPPIEPIFKYPSKQHWGEFVDWLRP